MKKSIWLESPVCMYLLKDGWSWVDKTRAACCFYARLIFSSHQHQWCTAGRCISVSCWCIFRLKAYPHWLFKHKDFQFSFHLLHLTTITMKLTRIFGVALMIVGPVYALQPGTLATENTCKGKMPTSTVKKCENKPCTFEFRVKITDDEDTGKL